MITILNDSVPDLGYYSDTFLKAFTLGPSPAGLVATIVVLGNVVDHTLQEIQNKLDAVTTFEISVTTL